MTGKELDPNTLDDSTVPPEAGAEPEPVKPEEEGDGKQRCQAVALLNVLQTFEGEADVALTGELEIDGKPISAFIYFGAESSPAKGVTCKVHEMVSAVGAVSGDAEVSFKGELTVNGEPIIF